MSRIHSPLYLQGDKCYYCGHKVFAPGTVPYRMVDATGDHRIPKCRGGLKDRNFVICCRLCNMAKGDMTEIEFDHLLRTGGLVVVPKPRFASEQEAYDFVKKIYDDVGGVSPELRHAYETYLRARPAQD